MALPGRAAVRPGVRASEVGPAGAIARGGLGDVAVAAALFLLAAAFFLWLAAGASSSGVITGEEASITHRDALSVALRWQPSIWSTNIGSQVFYWAAGHLTPEYGLLYARPVKAGAMALLVPLAFLVARRRLGCARPSAVAAAVVVPLLPGVSMMSWVATENGLEAVWGAAALLVATSARRTWPLGLPLAALAVSHYTAGLAWAAVVALVSVLRVRSPRAALEVFLAGALATTVVLVPLLWWDNGGIVVTGGGRGGFDPLGAPARALELLRLLAVDGASYYYFSSLPVWGAPLLAVGLGVALVVAVGARTRAMAPWVAVAVAATALYVTSGNVTGSRRVVALSVVAGLAVGVCADLLGGLAHRRGARAVVAIVAVASVAVVCLPGTVSWHSDVVAGSRRLPTDWPFPVDPGGTQGSTLARLGDDLRARRLTVQEVGDGWGGTRTLSMIYMLDERAGRVPAFDPGQIVAYYRTTDDCALLDGPACTRR